MLPSNGSFLKIFFSPFRFSAAMYWTLVSQRAHILRSAICSAICCQRVEPFYIKALLIFETYGKIVDWKESFFMSTASFDADERAFLKWNQLSRESRGNEFRRPLMTDWNDIRTDWRDSANWMADFAMREKSFRRSASNSTRLGFGSFRKQNDNKKKTRKINSTAQH